MKETPYTANKRVRKAKGLVFILAGWTVGVIRGGKDILGLLESNWESEEPYG